ncbi:MAG TPA: acyl-CoA reductase [Chitinophagaceae bacterium]|nr:acyl-CoA reductase [Chitinophagaceae bacterium]
MNLPHRIDLMARLGAYIISSPPDWQMAREKAGYENGWFTPAFIDKAANHIAENWLHKNSLEKWIAPYTFPHEQKDPRTVGIVMAGNIPLVGFHDMLAVFISGHRALIKTSSKDRVLITELIEKLKAFDPRVGEWIQVAEMLKGADAYIATGSNNSSRYFEHYFGKYPHIIRGNKTSVAVLTGNESIEELEQLADDVHLYFGLGCRNVTKIYLPPHFEFITLLDVFKKYHYIADHHKYKNNYDYNLAILLLNKKYYMTNGSILLVEEASPFSPISQLHYESFTDRESLMDSLDRDIRLQCIVSKERQPFGRSQCPALHDYADGVDTLAFLAKL